jgi:hypothetical protein
VLPRFLYYYLNSSAARAELSRIQSTTSGLRNLNTKLYIGQTVPLPPPSEQRRIVGILDRADRLRSLRAEADAKADRIPAALFLKVFGDPSTNPMGWPVVRFGNVFTDITSRCQKLQRKDYRAGGRFPVVDQSKEPIAGYCDDEHFCYRPERPVIVFGDHTRVVKLIDFPFVAGADGSRVFSVNRSFVPEFAAVLLRLQRVPDLGYSRHMRAVRQLNFVAPPLAKQTQFAKAYRSHRLTDVHRGQALERVEGLWKVVLARAFSGSLTKSWRHAHMKELHQEMERQAQALAAG